MLLKLNRVGDIRRDSERPDEFASTLQSQILELCLALNLRGSGARLDGGAELVGTSRRFRLLKPGLHRRQQCRIMGKTLPKKLVTAKQLN